MASRKIAFLVPLAILGAAISGQGCGVADKAAAAQADLCCTDFNVGADMSGVDWKITGDVKLTWSGFIQAVGDFSAAASATVTDVGNACQAIAVDLGEDEKSVTETVPSARANAWCAKAVAKINSEVKAKGTIKVVAQPPSCTVSASAQGSCEAKCSANASCEITPAMITARCDPGQLSVQCGGSCMGSCEGSADAAVSCAGECQGSCDGMCNGMSMGGTSSGQCAGKCDGKCRGTCKVTPPMVKCEGSCTGGCTGTATAPKCKGELKPPEAMCSANADCGGSCKASASAKAECKPGSLTIEASGNIDANAITTLKVNLPKLIVAVQARGAAFVANGQAMVSLSAKLAPDAPKFSLKASACVIPVTKAIGTALENASAGVQAGGTVTAMVGM